MAANSLQDRASALIGQLAPDQLAAVVQLLEVMIHDDDNDEEELTEDDRRALRASKEYFRNGGKGTPFERVVEELGFTHTGQISNVPGGFSLIVRNRNKGMET